MMSVHQSRPTSIDAWSHSLNHMDTDMGDLPVPMLSSKQTPVTPEQLMVRLGEMVLALLLGEIIHRIILIFEELPHVKERSDIIVLMDV